MWDVPQHTAIPAWQTALVIGMWLVPVLFWFGRGVIGAAFAKFFSQTLGRKLLILFALAAITITGADKGASVSQVFRLLFFDPLSDAWPLAEPERDVEEAEQAVVTATNLASQAKEVIDNNEIWTLSFDWHAPDRLPYHERQNVMGWPAAVVPTNINDVLYEDHYVAFNSTASTNPAVILIEYAQTTPAGIVRYSAEVVTNSYPDTAVVSLQSGSHTCYWFRVAVPVAFTNAVRDWNGEALFGSPSGSGRGFELQGTLVVDDGDDIWVGATTNIVFGAATNEFKNGINVTEEL